MKQQIRIVTLILAFTSLGLLAPVTAFALTCDVAPSAGGGAAGLSPGPVGPPSSLGWDLGSGQCNGSFNVTSNPGFTGGALELGLRAEERRIGQVAPVGANYEVTLGPDANPPTAVNRAWWNFQISIAYGGAIANLDTLELIIRTDVGSNLPASTPIDLLALRGIIDDRNNQPNATVGYSDIYQISQNPEFGWFAPTADTDANPTGAFNYDEAGAWSFTVRAVEGGDVATVSICIHSPGEACTLPLPVELQNFSVD